MAEANLAKTFTGLVTKIAAKITAYTYAFYVNCLLAALKGAPKNYGPEPNNTHLGRSRRLNRSVSSGKTCTADEVLQHEMYSENTLHLSLCYSLFCGGLAKQIQR